MRLDHLLDALQGFSISAIVAVAMAHEAAAEDPAARQLFQDAGFSEGFGASRYFGIFATEKKIPPVIGYRDISPFRVHLIPEGPVRKGETRSHPWEFEEGLYLDILDESGKRIPELFEHRLAVNHVIEVNTPECLQFAQFNNSGLRKDDPRRNQRLNKRVWTDRKGTIRLYQNTSHEIRNVATGYLPRFSTDTWPHLLLVQVFAGEPKLADFEKLEFSLTFRVLSQKKLSDWPKDVPDGTPPDMNLQCYFYLRDLKNPKRNLWVGILLRASEPKTYFVLLDVDQWGTVIRREPITLSGPAPAVGESRAVRREIKSLARDALAAAAEKFPDKNLSTDPNDFLLEHFNIGWEGIGHWENECELSGISLLGFPQASAEVNPNIPPKPQQ